MRRPCRGRREGLPPLPSACGQGTTRKGGRMSATLINPHELAARLLKSIALTNTMRQFGIDAADAELMDDEMWRLAAKGAKVNYPGPETRRMVIDALRVRA